METDDCYEVSDNDTEILVVDIEKLPHFLNIDETLDDEVDVFNMTSLNMLMLLGKSGKKDTEDDNIHRLSLAYERLSTMPKILIQELGSLIKILDISNNEFQNLDFLSEFKELTSLICDHNKITANTVIPYLPKLELLWMNHCKITELYPWARKLQQSCPNLKYLSLMGNSMAPSYLNGGSLYEYLQYRLFIISLFPDLKHLDDRAVTEEQKQEAQRMYQKPFVERLMQKTQTKLPTYLRNVSDRVSDFVYTAPSSFSRPEKNCIV
ncbi:unnamed protein product [Brassicogethes aeneus]|uniref:Leucine-rich melanocyte differentiation-associated protein-like n=1 Tax=Brassicogethes aeneus TaxID=1431903 RepID=A0A9P0AZH7_BRAAE|nr:unnamed protein product [Brassicogethes aeneus]